MNLQEQNSHQRTDHGHRTRRLLVVLLLACATLITVDVGAGQDSPLDRVRGLVGDGVGPIESAVSTVTDPIAGIPEAMRTNRSLRSDVARLQAANDDLENRLAGSDQDAAEQRQLRGLVRASGNTGYALQPARVIAIGPAQSFSRAVTIDRGRRHGVRPDMTVLEQAGLVGRVLRADETTATVLLITDARSVVGGRLGADLEIGFLRGDGDLSGAGRLDLELVDATATPTQGDLVTTWGSKDGAPYVPGIRIGTIESVLTSPRDSTTRAVVRPAVDFSSLDIVAVVVAPGTPGAIVPDVKQPNSSKDSPKNSTGGQ